MCNKNNRDKLKGQQYQQSSFTPEAITTIRIALTLERIIATTTIRAMLTATMVHVPHSNTIFRLYILRNIYSKGISIKEICSFRKR